MRRAVSGYRFPLGAMGLVIALLLLVGACAPPATPIPLRPTPTTARAPMPEPGAEWDYVALGNSMAWGFPEYYAAHIEADLGVKVTVHDWTRGGLSSIGLLEMLRNNQELRRDISEAEVITFVAGGASMGFCLRGRGQYPFGVVPFEEYLPSFRADYDAMIDELLLLRSTSDTLIRAMDYYNPIGKRWKKSGVYDECKRAWESFNEQIFESCSARNIPVARVYLAFNGPNGDEDPTDKGYIMDGEHVNDVGAALIADLHRELGYEPLGP